MLDENCSVYFLVSLALAVADKHCGVVKTLAEEMKGTLHVVQQHLMRATKHDSEPE